MNTKYIFVVGGVISGVGKGIATASIGKILIGKNSILERHRHRYEVSPEFVHFLEDPAPLFLGLVEACTKRKRKNDKRNQNT